MPKKNQASEELIQQILDLRKLGKGRNTICEELKCSMNDVRYVLEKFNLNAPENKNAVEQKQCIACDEIKSIEEFDEYEVKKGGKKNGNKSRQLRCKSCYKVYITAERSRSYQKHREQRLVDAETYRNKPESKERFRKYIVEYCKTKRKENPNFRLRTWLSTYIGNCLKRNGGGKWGETVMDHLDYSLDELKNHLEDQFEPWMNWNNQGLYIRGEWDDNNSETWKWQLDHILPCSDFKYEKMDDPEFKKCWALANLRPYSAKQNVLDGTGRTRHKKNL